MLMNVERDLTTLSPANNQKFIYCGIFLKMINIFFSKLGKIFPYFLSGEVLNLFA